MVVVCCMRRDRRLFKIHTMITAKDEIRRIDSCAVYFVERTKELVADACHLEYLELLHDGLAISLNGINPFSSTCKCGCIECDGA